ncbi:iron/zinc/copper transport system substrate-binding protein [Gracilibacillus halotolerans]|uniref:Iron/zinc/copper transport system substrate-binding protein n=1 Tax=Gracilibacillus halotolerans TaxID=74386 RepID=A0A841RLI1_9BACI|nr:metal ABC transporter substrate-binding protein [Gracilibacillus halotolerans]MBB6511588.1 iron/zinc/copper transport system substrate-binding protein [Gracilibacillus halotolerans]
MKKRGFFIFLGIISTLLLLVGCADNDNSSSKAEAKGTNDSEDTLLVVTTYSIIYDIVKNVGGEHVEIHSLAPIGSNPHEYEPLPEDVQKSTDADAIFYNGLNLEAGNSWFDNLVETAGKTGDNAPVFRVSEGVEPMYLTTEGNEGEEDPHAWLDIQNGIKYAENARDAFISIDPDNEEIYRENTESYIAELEELHEKAIDQFSNLPDGKNVLVTSEGAFKYFSNAYGIDAEYIWEINQENQGTPEQVTRIVDIIKENGLEALFVETSIDPRSMEMVANESGADIKGEVFTDSLGKPGEDGDTYLKMMEWNIETIYNGLTE